MADWLDGELSAALKSRVDEHLAACASCRAAFDQMEALGGDLVLLGRAADRMAQSAARNVRPLRTWRRAWAQAAAVLLLIAGGTYLAIGRRDANRPVAIRQPTALHDGQYLSDAPVVVPPGVCRVEGHTAVAMASANPRVRIVWLYEDSRIGEGSTPSDGGAKPRPQG